MANPLEINENVIFYDIDGYPVKIGDTVGYSECIWDNATTPEEKHKYGTSYILLEWDEKGKEVLIQELDHEKAQQCIYVPDRTKEPFREYPSKLAAI